MKPCVACLLVALLALNVVPMPVASAGVHAAAAPSTTTWTSTADFDGGTKGTVPITGTTGYWTIQAPLPTPMSDQPSVTYNGKVTLFGGYTSGASPPVGTVQQYTVSTNSWASKTDMPTARWGAAAALVGSTAYVFAGDTDQLGTGTNKTEAYALDTDSWTTKAIVPAAFAHQGIMAATVGANVYIFYATGAAVYYPGNDTFQTLASSLKTRRWCQVAVVGTDVYLIGGFNATSGLASNSVRVYHTASNTWADSYDTAPYSAYGMPRESLVNGSLIYLTMGNDNTNFYKKLYAYAYAAKTWTELNPPIHSRDGVSAALVNGEVYVMGGRNFNVNPVGLPFNEKVSLITPTDGDYQVETATDNGAVASGSFALTGDTGDTYATAYGNGTTFKWNAVEKAASALGRCSLDHSIFGSVAYTNASNALNQNCWTGLSLKTGLSGDLDIKTKAVAYTGSNGLPHMEVLNKTGIDYTVAGTYGAAMRISVGAPSLVRGFSIANGVLTACGAGYSSIGTSVWMRITKSGQVWTFYYGTDGVTWTLQSTCNQWANGTLYYSQAVNIQVTGTHQTTWDSFQITTGTVAAPGYRTSGSWVSPLQTYDGTVPKVITLTYSGATSTYKVSQVAIVDGAGTVLWVDGTQVMSGTSTSYTVPFANVLRTSWAVQVTLVGDGAASMVMESISVSTAAAPGASGGAPSFAVSCTFNQIMVTWTCTDATNYTLFYVTAVYWSYDGVAVATSAPDTTVTFRPPGQGWFTLPGDHTLTVQTYGGTQATYALQLQTTEWQAWAFSIVLFVVVLAAAVRQVGAGADRSVYFMPVSNPEYRKTAISVDEYPKGWRSYRQHDPDRYVRLRSETMAERRRHPNRWTIYGIRPATVAEKERTGKKYVAEVQTVRERM